MRPVYFNVAISTNYQQPCPFEAASQMHQQVESAPVGVVQVLEDQTERLGCGGVPKKATPRLPPPEAVLFWACRLW